MIPSRRRSLPWILLVGLGLVADAEAQKKVSELTIVYDYALRDKSSEPKPILSATYSLYIKANRSRTELTNALFSSTVFLDDKTGTAVALKELNGQKILISMSADNWEDRNKRYQGIVFHKTSETKTIAGYSCSHAIAQTADSVTISVYYTSDLMTENKDYDPTFKNLDGFPLQYDLIKGDRVISYTLASINLNPVPASKFDIPKTGYREMSYEESIKQGSAN
jgi:GLPGLI family protein